MIVIFSHELAGLLSKAEDVQHFILDQADLPSNMFRAIENLELKSSEVKLLISMGDTSMALHSCLELLATC